MHASIHHLSKYEIDLKITKFIPGNVSALTNSRLLNLTLGLEAYQRPVHIAAIQKWMSQLSTVAQWSDPASYGIVTRVPRLSE